MILWAFCGTAEAVPFQSGSTENAKALYILGLVASSNCPYQLKCAEERPHFNGMRTTKHTVDETRCSVL